MRERPVQYIAMMERRMRGCWKGNIKAEQSGESYQVEQCVSFTCTQCIQSIQVVQGLPGGLLQLSEVLYDGCLDVLHLGGGIILQGLGAWWANNHMTDPGFSYSAQASTQDCTMLYNIRAHIDLLPTRATNFMVKG